MTHLPYYHFKRTALILLAFVFIAELIVILNAKDFSFDEVTKTWPDNVNPAIEYGVDEEDTLPVVNHPHTPDTSESFHVSARKSLAKLHTYSKERHPTGQINIESGEYWTEDTIEDAARVSWIGNNKYTRYGGVWIRPKDSFPHSDSLWYVVRSDVRKANYQMGKHLKDPKYGIRWPNYNGNFSKWIENIYLDGRKPNGQRVSKGIEFGGAQTSGINNMQVRWFTDTGITIASSTTRSVFTNLTISNCGRGINFSKLSAGCSASNLSVLTCPIGANIFATNGFKLTGLTTEGVPTALVMSGRCVNVTVEQINVARHYAGKPILDLTELPDTGHLHIELSGMLRLQNGVAQQPFYLDRKGEKQPLTSGNPKSRTWKPWRISL